MIKIVTCIMFVYANCNPLEYNPNDLPGFKLTQAELQNVKALAASGDLECQYKLGWCYIHGLLVNIDQPLGIKYYLEAANKGHPKAQFFLGISFEHGIGVPINWVESLKWHTKAADNGIAESQAKVGWHFFSGKIISKDLDKSFKYYLMAANQNYAPAQGRVGAFYSNGVGTQKDEKLSDMWYLKAANNGEAKAQATIGVKIINRHKNDKKKILEGLEWLEKAADQNNTEAQSLLGFYYEKGVLGQPNHNKAFRWYLIASNNGDNLAPGKVSQYYAFGRNIVKNPAEAYYWAHVDYNFNKDAPTKNWLLTCEKKLSKASASQIREKAELFLKQMNFANKTKNDSIRP